MVRLLPAFALSFALLAPSSCKKDKAAKSSGADPAPEAVAESREETEARIRTDLEKVVNAVYSAKVEEFEKYIPDEVVKMVGTREQFRKGMAKAFGELKKQGLRLEKIEFGEIEHYEGEVHDFVLVPADLTVMVNGEATEMKGHQFGLRRKGESNWKYIDCSSLTDELARKWYPDLPAECRVP